MDIKYYLDYTLIKFKCISYNIKENKMSWFKHKPRPKTPPKLHAHHSSPIAEKLLNETKIEVRGTTIEEQSSKTRLDKKKKK